MFKIAAIKWWHTAFIAAWFIWCCFAFLETAMFSVIFTSMKLSALKSFEEVIDLVNIASACAPVSLLYVEKFEQDQGAHYQL